MDAKLEVLAAIVAIVAVAGTAAADEKGAVRVAGLQVVAAGAGKNGSELRAFHEQSGVKLALVAEAPEGRFFVEVDDDRCELIKLVDSSGRDLLDGVDWDSFPDISEDGRFVLVDVGSKVRPAPGATTLVAHGSLHARVAAGTVTVKVDPFELREGFEFDVQGQSLHVVKLISEDGLTVMFQTSRSFDEDLKEVRFFDADGQPVEVWGRGSMTLGNSTQVEFNLEGNPESLSAEFELWQEPETVELPFELAVGLGLGE